MGSDIIARCKCGLDEQVLIGGGMNDFMTTCYFPCLCESCHRVVQANLLAKPLQCPQCQAADPIPYDDPRLKGKTGRKAVASWNMEEQLGRDLRLTDGFYKCPRCGEMTLRFVDGGVCWD